jgi:hypothetical protein
MVGKDKCKFMVYGLLFVVGVAIFQGSNHKDMPLLFPAFRKREK